MRVVPRDALDEGDVGTGDAGAAGAALGLTAQEVTQAAPLPAEHGLGSDDDQMLTPAFATLGPDSREQLPEQSISVLEGGTRDPAPEHHELVTQGEVRRIAVRWNQTKKARFASWTARVVRTMSMAWSPSQSGSSLSQGDDGSPGRRQR